MILSQLNSLYNNFIDLYRDDGLALFNETSRNIEIIKENIAKIFSKDDVKVTAEANIKVVDFSDINLDNSYRSLNKTNHTPLYVNKFSDHPPSILKNISQEILTNVHLTDLLIMQSPSNKIR